MKKTIRCSSYAAIGVALLLVGVQTAWAHTDPPLSTTTGITISLTAFRADGVTPVVPGEVTQCETIIYQATVSWPGGTNAAFSGGTITIDPPGPVGPVDVTGGTGTLPCIGGTFNGAGADDQCLGAPPFYVSQPLSFTASVADCSATPTLVASVLYAGGTSHLGASNTPGISGSTSLSIPVVCCGQDVLFCNGVEFCDPTKVGQFCRPAPGAPGVVCDGLNTGGDGFTHTGTCADGPDVADSTPCDTDTDGNDCTTPGCAGGVCLQTHNDVVVSTPCTDTGNECAAAGCDGAGTCDQLHSLDPDSTPCADVDGDICTTAGCDAVGTCQQLHLLNQDPSCLAEVAGRMNGGGSVFTTGGLRVTHGFELHCDVEIGPNNLEINWDGNHFHLEELTSVTCTDDPAIEPPPPGVDFDTYVGTGTGTCNGEEGATITFTLTDAGEPGAKDPPKDTATFQITCADGTTLTVSGDLKKGNHQALPENK